MIYDDGQAPRQSNRYWKKLNHGRTVNLSVIYSIVKIRF